MTDKIIKNEQWSIKQLISKIYNKDIIKPKFQRKKKWKIVPKNDDNKPNEKAYIQFLYENENSVHPITFGQGTNLHRIIYTNIDGNNRINAIKHYIDKPFEIFNEYLDNLKSFIDTIDLTNDEKNLLKNIFDNISYNDMVNFRYNTYFIQSGYKELYKSKIKIYRDDFEPYIDKINENLKTNNADRFDETVKVNVNLFEGYTTDELCQIFEDINKYTSSLTTTEILASRLHNSINFTINNKPFETELIQYIKKYYKDKSEDEVLQCYEFEGNINAHDFIVGFQNLCNEKYKFIGKTDVDGQSLFFKIWSGIYKDPNFDLFTTENVNDFIEKINYSCDILQDTISNIFTEKINEKLFNSTCQDKLKTLKKNNLFMLISSIIGFRNKKEQKKIIIKSLEKCLIYHFFVSDIKDKEQREDFKNHDSITYRAGGSFIENAVKKLLTNPETISNKLTEKLFNDLINCLIEETNTPYQRKLPNGNNKCDKRRNLKFFEKTLMFYYYKEKIPTNMLNRMFSIEHIMPNSSEWEGELDKDRTGNLIPIISTINSQRGNRHIKLYKTTQEGTGFYEFIKDIIPDDHVYDNIIQHDKKPTIINNNKYNELCENNEKKYKDNLINCLC